MRQLSSGTRCQGVNGVHRISCVEKRRQCLIRYTRMPPTDEIFVFHIVRSLLPPLYPMPSRHQEGDAYQCGENSTSPRCQAQALRILN